MILGDFAFAVSPCPACGVSLFVKFGSHEASVRCTGCRATPITLSLIAVLNELLPDLGRIRAYELSSRGPLVAFLKSRAMSLTMSEFHDDVAPGHWKHGVQCQDVARLTYGDGAFDLCTSTEVFEHVPDPDRGFRELHRVLAPGGHLVFTVPMSGRHDTVTRARMTGAGVEHLLPPEYHSDRIRGSGKVLCYRLYGDDIVEDLERAGFDDVSIRRPGHRGWLGFARNVIVARKGGTGVNGR